MSDYSYKHPSNVQLNKGHKHTDDFITKKYILKMLRDPQKLKSLIEEHRATQLEGLLLETTALFSTVKIFKHY